MASKKVGKKFKLSVLTPFYNEGEGIKDYFSQTIAIISQITKDWEIICIDDGSTDSTKEQLLKHAKNNSKIKVISLARNFGKEAALTAALDHATGDIVIPIDADLQDPPYVMKLMVQKWFEGYSVVNAVRKTRSDSRIKRWPAVMFHHLINFLSNGNIPVNVGDFRLIDKKALNAINNLREKTRYMKGIISWVGFKTTTIEYSRPMRNVGNSKLNFWKLVRLGYDGIFSFSSKPLKIWLYLGLLFSLTGFIYACYLILKTFIYGSVLPGYTSLMVAIIFIGGIQLISLGIIGEYVARIFKEVKNRPIYLIDEVTVVKKRAQKIE